MCNHCYFSLSYLNLFPFFKCLLYTWCCKPAFNFMNDVPEDDLTKQLGLTKKEENCTDIMDSVYSITKH